MLSAQVIIVVSTVVVQIAIIISVVINSSNRVLP